MSLQDSVPLVELTCPSCDNAMNAKPKCEIWLTRCLKCNVFFTVNPVIHTKPNKILFEFVTVAVPPVQQVKRELKAVS